MDTTLAQLVSEIFALTRAKQQLAQQAELHRQKIAELTETNRQLGEQLQARVDEVIALRAELDEANHQLGVQIQAVIDQHHELDALAARRRQKPAARVSPDAPAADAPDMPEPEAGE